MSICLTLLLFFFKQVCGWTRADPLSCILVTKMNHRNPKHKEVENPSPLCVDTMSPKSNSSVSIAEQNRESYTGLSNCKKSVLSNQQKHSWGPAKLPVLNVMQEDVTHLGRLLKITPQRSCHLSSPQHSVPENRQTTTRKHSHKSNNKVVTIKNLTLLPPIPPPQISRKDSCHVCGSKKALDGEKLEGKSAARRAGVDTVANRDISVYSEALTPKYHACQHIPHLFSALSVSPPKKNQLLKPLPDTVHPISQAVVRPHMPPRCLFS